MDAIFKLSNDSISPKNSAVFSTVSPNEESAKHLILSEISAFYFTEPHSHPDGLIKLIENNISVYHVDIKKIDDFDKTLENIEPANFQNFPEDFLTTIYKSDSIDKGGVMKFIIRDKKKAIEDVKDMFLNYYDGKYHYKWYDLKEEREKLQK